MKSPVLPSDLSHAEHRLLTWMQQIRFGRIENLLVRDGQPIIQRGVTIGTRKIRTRGENRPHPGSAPDAQLKPEVVVAFSHIRELGHGTVASITLVDGLPIEMEIADERDDTPGVGTPTCRPPRPPVLPAVVR